MEPAKKQARCGRNSRVVKVYGQLQFLSFERAAAGPLEMSRLAGKENASNEDEVMIVFDGRENAGHWMQDPMEQVQES